VLDAKGGENKAKARNGSATTWEFWNSRVRAFVCQNTRVCLLLSKVGLLWGEGLIMGKRGSFWIFDQFLLKYLSLCSNKCGDLEIGNWVWFAKTKPSGGKGWSIYAKFESKQFWVLICIDVALPLVAFLLCWHKSPKRGKLKGKCALGPFLCILVIECQHKWTHVNLCKVMDKVQIK
jgi:hypothetical protein